MNRILTGGIEDLQSRLSIREGQANATTETQDQAILQNGNVHFCTGKYPFQLPLSFREQMEAQFGQQE